jgi:STE24 endopeptidase
MSASTLSIVFSAFVRASVLVLFWLATRQMRLVAHHRAQVPTAFAATVTPEAHRKAADYTLAKGRFGLWQQAITAAVLLGWTLLGGLDALNAWVVDATVPVFGTLGYQIALVVAFSLIAGLIDLPADWHATFHIEQRFGFNRMTPRMWVMDQLKGALVGAVIGLPLLALVLWLMGAAGSAWWLWAWGAWMAFNLVLLVLSGAVTAIPLMLYANGAKLLRLTTIGIMQYIAPTMIFLIAVFIFGEPFGSARLIAFILIWTALALYSFSLFQNRRLVTSG